MQHNISMTDTGRQIGHPKYPSRRDQSLKAQAQRKRYQKWWRDQQKLKRQQPHPPKPENNGHGKQAAMLQLDQVEKAYLCECPACHRKFYMTKV